MSIRLTLTRKEQQRQLKDCEKQGHVRLSFQRWNQIGWRVRTVSNSQILRPGVTILWVVSQVFKRTSLFRNQVIIRAVKVNNCCYSDNLEAACSIIALIYLFRKGTIDCSNNKSDCEVIYYTARQVIGDPLTHWRQIGRPNARLNTT